MFNWYEHFLHSFATYPFLFARIRKFKRDDYVISRYYPHRKEIKKPVISIVSVRPHLSQFLFYTHYASDDKTGRVNIRRTVGGSGYLEQIHIYEQRGACVSNENNASFLTTKTQTYACVTKEWMLPHSTVVVLSLLLWRQWRRWIINFMVIIKHFLGGFFGTITNSEFH